MFHGALLAFTGDTPAMSLEGGFQVGVGFALKKNNAECMATPLQIQQKVT